MIPEHCESFAVAMAVSPIWSGSHEELLEKCQEGENEGEFC